MAKKEQDISKDDLAKELQTQKVEHSDKMRRYVNLMAQLKQLEPEIDTHLQRIEFIERELGQ